MGDRSVREDMVWAALAYTPWSRNFREVGDAMGIYEDTWGIDFIAPGDSSDGRGTTILDGVRAVPRSGGIQRYDYVAFKSHGIGSDGKRPAYADLATGNRGTIRAIIGAAHRGVALPVIHFISEGGSNNPSEHGWFRAFDAAPIIRGCLNDGSEPSSVGHEYGRGQAPAAYIGRVARASGGKYKKHRPGAVYDGWTVAVAEDRLSYPQLRIGYKAAGVGDWRPCHVADMPAILESFDWPNLGLFGE
jgi:hypothetical protein